MDLKGTLNDLLVPEREAEATRILWEQIEKIGRTAPKRSPEPHWKALEDVTGVECGAFMFMGESKNGQFWMFKNIDTRRYIFLPIPREW